MSLDLEHNAWPSDSAATVISIDAEVIISRTGSKQGLHHQHPLRLDWSVSYNFFILTYASSHEASSNPQDRGPDFRGIE